MNHSIKILRKIPRKWGNISHEESPFSKKPENNAPAVSEENSIFITCQAGLEALVKKDNEKLGIKNFEIQDRIVRAQATEKQLYEALIWNRFSNRVYLELGQKKCETFDELFLTVEKISWEKYLPEEIAIVTEATSIKSTLSHTPSIQSIAKKAIVNRLTRHQDSHHLYENRRGDEAHIQIFIIQNNVHILLDITGSALHKRGYRLETGDAPIKETLAAALVALSGWKFHETFLDPFCGSGTIAIEAALLAKNIAPGRDRHFAIENFPFFSREIFQNVQKEAATKIFDTKKYQIFASDKDESMIKIARDNAVRAGVRDDIIFSTEDFFERPFHEAVTIVTNPPYGVRLENENDEIFYKKYINTFLKENISWGFITSYEKIEDLSPKNAWKNRKLYNGGIPARFYKKQNPS